MWTNIGLIPSKVSVPFYMSSHTSHKRSAHVELRPKTRYGHELLHLKLTSDYNGFYLDSFSAMCEYLHESCGIMQLEPLTLWRRRGVLNCEMNDDYFPIKMRITIFNVWILPATENRNILHVSCELVFVEKLQFTVMGFAQKCIRNKKQLSNRGTCSGRVKLTPASIFFTSHMN